MSTYRRAHSGDGTVLLIFFGCILIYVLGCVWFYHNAAAHPYPSNHNDALYGFVQGFFLAPAFVFSLFNDNIAIYQAGNIGGWYDFFYLVGAGVLLKSTT